MSISGLQTTIVSTDLSRSKAFYDRLGLEYVDDDGGLNYKAGTDRLYIYHRDAPPRADHTLFSLEVADITKVLTDLKQEGIEAAHYDGFDQDKLGVAVEPQSGRKGAWITDPDGNIIGMFEA